MLHAISILVGQLLTPCHDIYGGAWMLGDGVPDVDSGKRDPLLDTQYARMPYFSYKDILLCSMCRLARDVSRAYLSIAVF